MSIALCPRQPAPPRRPVGSQPSPRHVQPASCVLLSLCCFSLPSIHPSPAPSSPKCPVCSSQAAVLPGTLQYTCLHILTRGTTPFPSNSLSNPVHPPNVQRRLHSRGVSLAATLMSPVSELTGAAAAPPHCFCRVCARRFSTRALALVVLVLCCDHCPPRSA